ncbi:hypothetical protein OQJ13_05925 [Legionella sp. PATHC035]|uniref:hypothetical protein n=1 Tax=Legionella sp. PATHC035 TaxID=2992040 RepID=UPI0022443EF7|nr:hypothetical protein [Legionella sp. PATHC035]MCW8408508.1 hypothetical protein [Legionella sp. PATHC035]
MYYSYRFIERIIDYDAHLGRKQNQTNKKTDDKPENCLQELFFSLLNHAIIVLKIPPKKDIRI